MGKFSQKDIWYYCTEGQAEVHKQDSSIGPWSFKVLKFNSTTLKVLYLFVFCTCIKKHLKLFCVKNSLDEFELIIGH